MVSFKYVVKDQAGIHARPAGLLVKEVKKTGAKVTLECDGKSAEATKLMAVMAMGVKCGKEITVSVEGDNEAETPKALEEFFKENL